MAGRKPILRIGGDPSEARAAVRKLRDDVQQFKTESGEARLKVQTDVAEAKIAAVKERLERLGRQEATPAVKIRMERAFLELDRLEAKLERLDHKDVNIGIGGAIGSALAGVSGAASGLLGMLPGVGSAIGSIGAESAAAAPLLLLLVAAVAALAASLGAAVVGLGALAVALAAAFGPIIAVAIGAITRLVAIFQALHQQHTNTAASAQRVAAAHDQVTAATQAVANAQDNLRTQTTAAYQAWQDSIEAVKDDLRDVEHAQLGITDASLSLREAQQALKDFRTQAGAGAGLDGLFRKLTDVNFKGSISGALSNAVPGLSGDDELKLERLILNVKEAKLHEKDATDALHDSNVKLSRDRQTEAKFAQQGISAYPGYTSAVQGLATAQRQLATAQRNSLSAAAAQQGALAKLSPVEQRLARTIGVFRDLLSHAFGPAINAVLDGVNRGLQIFAATLTDPRIKSALTDLGRAMGNAFIVFASALSTPQMRGLFVELITGAARLVRILSTRVFVDLLQIFMQIATAAMPALVGLFSSLADTLDRWATWIRTHPKQFKKDLNDFIRNTKEWLTLIGRIIAVLGDVVKVLAPIGLAMIEGLLHPIRTIRRGFSAFIGWVGDALGGYVSHIGDLGRQWGHAFASGFHAAVSFVGKIATDIANAVISVINIFIGAIDTVIGAINSLPHIKTPFGSVGFPHIGEIDKIARLGDTTAGSNIPKNKLATGGLVTRMTTALIGEGNREEAVLPLTDDTVMRRLGDRIAASIGLHALTPGAALAGAPAGVGARAAGDVHIHVHSPAGSAPEPMTAGAQIERELRKRGLA
jgi:hypothetical protein